ncbi:MAG TPA: secondary thiamine-phosphate synthase enzyme YjbQ [Actinomycetota bacterium]|nr:secondary thiamine-phosphate synthase enzyme YjbQ [Actinomycetota bacterium]
MRVWRQAVSVTAPLRHSAVDLSEELQRALKDSGVTDGFAVAFCEHTTCALVINEWEQGLLADVTRRLRTFVPDDDYYAHDDLSIRTENLVEEERVNGPAHVASIVLGATSQTIPVVGGDAALGRWQKLFLLELDEPKDRTITFHIYGA